MIFPIWMCCVTETEPAAVSYHFPLYTGETKLAASDVVKDFHGNQSHWLGARGHMVIFMCIPSSRRKPA